MKPVHCLMVLLCAAAAGCQTFSSTMLMRLDDNSFVGNSNGEPDMHCSTRPYKGVPITLRVPSHLDVYIEESAYLQNDGNATASEPLNCRLLKVRTQIVKTKKVFTVDFKRPAAGELNAQLGFTDEQYFQNISSKLSDTTISDTASLIASLGAILAPPVAGGIAPPPITNGVNNGIPSNVNPVVPTGQIPPGNGVTIPTNPSLNPGNTHTSGQFPTATHTADGDPTPTELAKLPANVIREERVVAYRRFDLNAPDFEYQVEAFVNHHLNDCDRCGQRPAYDNGEPPWQQ